MHLASVYLTAVLVSLNCATSGLCSDGSNLGRPYEPFRRTDEVLREQKLCASNIDWQFWAKKDSRTIQVPGQLCLSVLVRPKVYLERLRSQRKLSDGQMIMNKCQIFDGQLPKKGESFSDAAVTKFSSPRCLGIVRFRLTGPPGAW